MQRPSPWLMLVVLLLGMLLVRETRFSKIDDSFLAWLLVHSEASGPAVPLTVVDLGREQVIDPLRLRGAEVETGDGAGATTVVSPLEFALFLQAVLEFQPGVIAFENILKWRERDKDQEQVFLDQAMRVPKLLLGMELGPTADPDVAWGDIRGFPQVTGKRGELAPFAGIERQANEDLRLISIPGYVNLPDDYTSRIRVPLLFLYRGEVIPSFPLQAILLWLRITPADVKVVLGSHIELPQNRRIPIDPDGTTLIDPSALQRARRLSMNELLLAAQQREAAPAEGREPLDARDHIVLARTPANPLSPPNLFAATIATIQGGKYLHRISRVFDCVFLLVLAALLPTLRRIDRVTLILVGIGFTAAYIVAALGMVSRGNTWLPGVIPLSALWLAIIYALFFRTRRVSAAVDPTTTMPPPVM